MSVCPVRVAYLGRIAVALRLVPATEDTTTMVPWFVNPALRPVLHATAALL